MLDRIRIIVRPHFAAAFRQAALDYDALMRAEIGQLISSEPGREVRRICIAPVIEAPNHILKRNWERTPFSWVAKKFLRGRAQRSRACQEAEALVALERAGVAVNEPVAWGERTRLGVPIEGFLLVREVPGTDGVTFWRNASSRIRGRLMRDAGTLLGRLHGGGFPEYVRIKDLFCGEVPDDPRQPISIVLIDREASPKRRARPSPLLLAVQLARSYVGFLDVNDEPTLLQIARFRSAYLAEVPELRHMSLTEFFALVSHGFQRLAKESDYAAAAIARSRFTRRVER